MSAPTRAVTDAPDTPRPPVHRGHLESQAKWSRSSAPAESRPFGATTFRVVSTRSDHRHGTRRHRQPRLFQRPHSRPVLDARLGAW